MFALTTSKVLAVTFVAAAGVGLTVSTRLAVAQSEASSTPPVMTTEAATSSGDETMEDNEAPEPIVEPSTITEAVVSPGSPPAASPALKLVQRVGTKYTDYCSDGSRLIAVPGDPAIDANLHLPDAPTPKCPDGMTWDHTSGTDAFDTASGDLEAGTYAVQADGTYIARFAATTFTDATSTAAWAERTVTLPQDPVASYDRTGLPLAQ